MIKGNFQIIYWKNFILLQKPIKINILKKPEFFSFLCHLFKRLSTSTFCYLICCFQFVIAVTIEDLDHISLKLYRQFVFRRAQRLSLSRHHEALNFVLVVVNY